MKGIRLITVMGCLLASHSALAAGTYTGTVNVNLVLTTACIVNGTNAPTGPVALGILDFGAHGTTFSTLTTQLNNSGNPTFTVACSTGDTYTVILASSTNQPPAPTTVVGTAGNPPRYVLNTSDSTKGVYYSVYDAAAMTTALANGATITPDSSPSPGTNTYTLYGKIVGNGTNTGITAGTYTDVLTININY
ncbi:spore coat protein U domain-containing protein [Arsenophonus apicola]|uniref:Spore coat protein U domain-containing protein n=1 Tax=Arsenophonus apicola TaxID=2879119 RepID=A0ABY8P205_9GAMM|nr:spore coat protein U domain-containing protein [Arsenophonus apicola]WGO83537.1 spore coat protein U domain-containing protein [Arsenophonus apicola]